MLHKLKEKMYDVVETIEANNIGIAFSGGVDSSLLTQICKDVGKTITLLTVSFSSLKDINIAKEVSRSFDLQLSYDIITMEELERGLKTVLSIIEFEKIAQLENAICFYYVFNLASKYRINTVLSANGADELFCGYNVYRNSCKDESLRKLMYMLVEIAKKDQKEFEKLSALFDIQYLCPFLSDNFIEFAITIPMKFKIKSKDDELRKHILRKVALEIGIPKTIALRPKKAFQYSSGLHKLIAKLAKRHGFTKKCAKQAGYNSRLEAYIESLRQKLDIN